MEEGLLRAEESEQHTAEKYQVELPQWSGPYDLLLKVIQEQDLDLFDLDISKLLDHYLIHLEKLNVVDIDEAGEFLVVAATLAQIKSKMLLPEDPTEVTEEEVDPREELVYYLQEYQKIKKFAAELRERPLLGRDVFAKGLSERFAGLETEGKGTLFQLVKGFQLALKRTQTYDDFSVDREEVSVSERLAEILGQLDTKGELAFNELLPENRGKTFIIATFLAVLELVRLKQVLLFQRELENEIFLEKSDGTSSGEVISSEFDASTEAVAEQSLNQEEGR